MTRLFSASLLLLTGLLVPATALAQPSAELSDPHWGLRLAAPEGWIGQAVEGGFLFGSNETPGLLVVLPHEARDLATLRAEAQQGLQEAGGTDLRLAGALQPFGDHGLRGDFEGTLQGEAARAHAIGLISPHGAGATVLAVTTTAAYGEAHATAAEALARSIVFSPPQTPPVVEEWKHTLADMRLTYLSSYYSSGVDGSYAGGSTESTIDLCSAGYFHYGYSSSISVDGGTGMGYQGSASGHGQDQGQGRWEVTAPGGQPTLVLHFHDGRTKTYQLSYEENKTFLNGERYYRTGTDAPIDRHRPNC